jgi:hypothetical protein
VERRWAQRYDSQRTLDRVEMLTGVRKSFSEAIAGPIVNLLEWWYDSVAPTPWQLRYWQEWSASGEGNSRHYLRVASSVDLYSQSQTWGVRRRLVYSDWIRTQAVAEGMVYFYRLLYSWRRFVATFEVSLRHLDLEVGDYALLEDADSRLPGAPGRVMAVRQPVADVLRLSFVVGDMRGRIWEYDAENYIDLFTGIVRMVFVVGGVVRMLVDAEGNLWLGDSVREEAYGSEVLQAASDSPNGEIEYHAANQSISFGLPRESDGAYTRVAELLPSGVLQIAAVREDKSYPLSEAASPAFSAYYEWFAGLGALDFTLDFLRTYLRFERRAVTGINNTRLCIREVREHAI